MDIKSSDFKYLQINPLIWTSPLIMFWKYFQAPLTPYHKTFIHIRNIFCIQDTLITGRLEKSKQSLYKSIN